MEKWILQYHLQSHTHKIPTCKSNKTYAGFKGRKRGWKPPKLVIRHESTHSGSMNYKKDKLKEIHSDKLNAKSQGQSKNLESSKKKKKAPLITYKGSAVRLTVCVGPLDHVP